MAGVDNQRGRMYIYVCIDVDVQYHGAEATPEEGDTQQQQMLVAAHQYWSIRKRKEERKWRIQNDSRKPEKKNKERGVTRRAERLKFIEHY